MAASLNIKVALYPHFGFGIATMPQAMDLIGKVNHPNLGVMFNLCHFLKSENAEDLEKALKQAGPRLFGVSTAGADIDGKGWGALIQTLDQGSFPQKRLLKALDAADFHGPITLQCYALPGGKRTNLEKSMSAWKRFNGVVGKTPPNIIVLLCDDLGYGDVQCLNPERGKIPTPHLDALAKSGMIFTDTHSASAAFLSPKDSDRKVDFKQDGAALKISLTGQALDPDDSVVKVSLSAPFQTQTPR